MQRKVLPYYLSSRCRILATELVFLRSGRRGVWAKVSNRLVQVEARLESNVALFREVISSKVDLVNMLVIRESLRDLGSLLVSVVIVYQINFAQMVAILGCADSDHRDVHVVQMNTFKLCNSNEKYADQSSDIRILVFKGDIRP